MGQNIRLNDPADLPEPTYDNRLRSADDPQWQCTAGEKFWGGFEGLPWHCQYADMINKALNGDQLWTIEANPKQITFDEIDSPVPGMYSASDDVLIYATTITSKEQNEESGPCPNGYVKIKGKCRKKLAKVNVKIPEIDKTTNVAPDPGELANIEPIDFSKEPPFSARLFSRIDSLVRFAYSHVKFVNTNEGYEVEKEQNQSRVMDQVIWMVVSISCAQAFRNAGLPTPAEILRDRGITYASPAILFTANGYKAIGDWYNDEAKEAGKPSALKVGVPAFTQFPKPYSDYPNARIVTFLQPGAFQETYYTFEETIIHEMIHAAGMGMSGSSIPYPGSHDLSGYEHYKAILEACALPK